MSNPKKQRGAVLPFVATMMIVLLAFAALAIDYGYLLIIRSQLQNAADAAALAGANYLFPYDATGSPNWSLAENNALKVAQLNNVAGSPILNATITRGYWNIGGGSPPIKSTTITQGQYDLTAIQVEIAKKTGQNGGPVKLFFGPIIGINTVDVSARAVGVVGAPSSISSGKIFPLAMSQALYNTYWDKTVNGPKIDPTTGQPYIFRTGNGTGQGEWTTFNSTASDTNTIINFIQNGSPINYQIGDMIYMAPGVKTTIFSSVPSNVDVLVPIVKDPSLSIAQPILAFGAIHIDFALGGTSKYIQVHFTNSYKVYGQEPGGISYGVYTASRLAQ